MTKRKQFGDPCAKCGAPITLANVRWRDREKELIYSYCAPCATANTMASAKANPQAHTARTKRYRAKLRLEVLAGYGNRCACCGETEPKFLTLDHVHNDGGRVRARDPNASFSEYVRARREGFPPDLQILCWNCNCGRAHNKGVCPHVNR